MKNGTPRIYFLIMLFFAVYSNRSVTVLENEQFWNEAVPFVETENSFELHTTFYNKDFVYIYQNRYFIGSGFRFVGTKARIPSYAFIA